MVQSPTSLLERPSPDTDFTVIIYAHESAVKLTVIAAQIQILPRDKLRKNPGSKPQTESVTKEILGCTIFSREETKGQFRKRVVLANAPLLRFSFSGTRERTLVPVFVPGNIRMYLRSGLCSGGNIHQNHPFGKPSCEPLRIACVCARLCVCFAFMCILVRVCAFFRLPKSPAKKHCAELSKYVQNRFNAIPP